MNHRCSINIHRINAFHSKKVPGIAKTSDIKANEDKGNMAVEFQFLGAST